MAALSPFEAAIGQISIGLGALLGLNYYSLVWAFVGAFIPLTQSRRFEGFTAIGWVLFSTLLGALISTFTADMMGITQRSAISFLAVIGGASWQTIITIAIRGFEESFKGVITSFFKRKE